MQINEDKKMSRLELEKAYGNDFADLLENTLFKINIFPKEKSFYYNLFLINYNNKCSLTEDKAHITFDTLGDNILHMFFEQKMLEEKMKSSSSFPKFIDVLNSNKNYIDICHFLNLNLLVDQIYQPTQETINTPFNSKKYADLFEAIIGIMYSEEGLEKTFNYLNHIFTSHFKVKNIIDIFLIEHSANFSSDFVKAQLKAFIAEDKYLFTKDSIAKWNQVCILDKNTKKEIAYGYSRTNDKHALALAYYNLKS